MVLRSAESSVNEENDLVDVRSRYRYTLASLSVDLDPPSEL
jgi:hypothetical protein